MNIISKKFKLIYIIFSLIPIILILYFFIGFPISQFNYIFAYNPSDFPYKICKEGKICEVKLGEVFTHEWFSKQENCLGSASAGYGYRTNYSYSNNIQKIKKGLIKFGWSMFSCPMVSYDLFEAKKSDGEYYFSYDFKCIHPDCKEETVKEFIKILE